MLKAQFCSTCIFLLALFSINRVYASDHFLRAVGIYSEGKFFEASIEFERAIFYEKDSNHIALYKYYKSLCYKGLAKYDRAMEELNSINMKNVPDSIFMVIHYEQILCSYLNNDLNQALHNIDEIYMRFRDTLKILEFIPLDILCLNACREWDNALILWNYYIENSMLEDSAKNDFKQEIYRLYTKKNIPRFCSPGKAAKLSGFLPGSGQIYCGAVTEGSFNLLINATLLFYTIREFYYKYYVTGYMVGGKLFRKFYKGGIRRANLLALEKNDEGIKKFNAENSSLMIRFYNTKSSENPGSSIDFRYP
jgi:tetratricopeptide (TPR) repeat protein